MITFAPGTAGSVVCNNISINDDDICEETEDFNLVLGSGPDGGSSISNSPGMVFIIDDDGTRNDLLSSIYLDTDYHPTNTTLKSTN